MLRDERAQQTNNNRDLTARVVAFMSVRCGCYYMSVVEKRRHAAGIRRGEPRAVGSAATTTDTADGSQRSDEHQH